MPLSRSANAVPLIAWLSLSVPPEVNTTSTGQQPSSAATRARASSRRVRGPPPQAWTLEGLPNSSRNIGSIASTTSGPNRRRRVVIEIDRLHNAVLHRVGGQAGMHISQAMHLPGSKLDDPALAIDVQRLGRADGETGPAVDALGLVALDVALERLDPHPLLLEELDPLAVLALRAGEVEDDEPLLLRG